MTSKSPVPAEAEDLQTNPLFKAFMSLTPDLFKQAAKSNYVVCVPVAASLKLAKINKEFVQTHCLTVSPFGHDEFLTCSNKAVQLKGAFCPPLLLPLAFVSQALS